MFLLSYTFIAKSVAQLDLESRFSLGLNPVQLQEMRQSVKVTLALTHIEWQVSHRGEYSRTVLANYPSWMYLLFSAICVMGKYVA